MMSVKHTHTSSSGHSHFLTFPFSYPHCQTVSVRVSVHLSNVSASNTLLFSPPSRCLCSHRSWQTFWRSVTWCSQACSAWRCCWSCWLWASSATSKTPTMASTASLSSSGELLLPSALRLRTECSPRLADIARLYIFFKNALSVFVANLRFWKIRSRRALLLGGCAHHFTWVRRQWALLRKSGNF